jgi:hypothetical protein
LGHSNYAMTIKIELVRNEDGSIKKTVTIEGDEFRFYEVIGIMELTKQELCEEEKLRSKLTIKE